MNPNPPELVQVRDVAVRYGRMDALDSVSLSVRAGETVTVVGPSGAGKTTLLRVMSANLRPSAGNVVVDGHDLSQLRPGRDLNRLVGMMRQRFDLVPQLSVRHNVEAGHLGRWSLAKAAAAMLLPFGDSAARRTIERVGLGGREGERTSRLSGGEQQRVALARLLVQDPAVILADEPVASLDPALADDVLALLTGIARESGKALIASLHSPELARQHFDRVVGLRDGVVEFDVTASRLTDDMLRSVYRDGRRGATVIHIMEQEPLAG